RSRFIDVRARVTNGSPELVIKHGEWGSSKRIETLVECRENQFETLVMALVALGFKQGVGCRRIIERYMDNDIELSVIHVPNYTNFYEAELLAPLGTEDTAMVRLEEWAKGLGLRVFTKAEFLQFIDDLDANANDSLRMDLDHSWEVIRQQTKAS